MKKERIIYLDVIRVMACCMIVLMHSPHPNAGNPGYVVVPISFITAAGLCLFFMVSGALLLPVQTPSFEFLKKRMGKIIFPTLFWTLMYLAASCIWDGMSLRDAGIAILSIPFSKQGHGILWFMYTLTGLYLLAPILSPFLKQSSRREIRFYLLLWGITLLYPWLKGFVVIDELPQGILYYFTGYAGYFVLGYYLDTYKPKVHPLVSLLLIIIPIVALSIYEFTGHEGWESSGRFWYLSIFVAMMCIGWFNIIRCFCGKLKTNILTNNKRGSISSFLVTFSNLGFGIYLMHILVMRYMLWQSDFIVHRLGGIGQIVMTWGLTLAICFVLTYALSYLPFSEYIIGYHHKRK